MSVRAADFDVFLSYSLSDRGTATEVSQALVNAGLRVFDPLCADLDLGQYLAETIHRALAASDALVVVLPSEGELRANAAIELGAAVALGKPVCVVRPENGKARVPEYLNRYQQYPISRIADVVQAVRRGQKPFSPKDLDVLKEIYVEMHVPADHLARDPARLDELTDEFRARAGSPVSPEQLLYEMFRQRKRGQWPRLKTSRTARK